MAKKPTTETTQPGQDREYEVLSPVNHDSIAYGVGEPIVLGEAVAAPLIKVGAIK